MNEIVSDAEFSSGLMLIALQWHEPVRKHSAGF
jgi:hypothetical protein